MRKFLLYSSALVVFGLSGGAAEAACIQTPTCSSLGYTSTSSCTGGTKCPFGNYWNCTASDLSNKIIEQTNKITELETQITELKKEMVTSNCQVGDILYSDMSCNPNVVSGKTPIGVVFDRVNRRAIALDSRVVTSWSDAFFDVPELNNLLEFGTVDAKGDWDGKKNTQIVLDYCKAKGKRCLAFEYVSRYKTEGTQAGDWYLPAISELALIYDSKEDINLALKKNGVLALAGGTHWSSSECSDLSVWTIDFSNGNFTSATSKMDTSIYALPVLAF